MRDLIKISAGLFISIGVLVFLIAGWLAMKVFGAPNGLENESAVGVTIALGGLVSSASIILFGGSAFMLVAIDERLEGVFGRKKDAGDAFAEGQF